MDRERPLEGGDWRVKTHPAPSPYQALGLGGRSRPGQCCPCGADRPGREGARRGRVVAYSVKTRAHRRRAKVRIGPPRRLRTPVRP